MFFSLFLISYLIASLTLSIVYYDYYAAFYPVEINLKNTKSLPSGG